MYTIFFSPHLPLFSTFTFSHSNLFSLFCFAHTFFKACVISSHQASLKRRITPSATTFSQPLMLVHARIILAYIYISAGAKQLFAHIMTPHFDSSELFISLSVFHLFEVRIKSILKSTAFKHNPFVYQITIYIYKSKSYIKKIKKLKTHIYTPLTRARIG